MSITGYNVDPESSDPTAGIEMNQYSNEYDKIDSLGRPTAALYIDETELTLNYEEVCALQALTATTRRQMEWAMSVWAYASDRPWTQKTHIIRWPNKEDAKSFCGCEPHQFGPEITEKYGPCKWDLNPLFQPVVECPSWLCKKCHAAYRKAQGHKEEKAS